MKSRLILMGGILGFLGVLAGTFGAHGLNTILPQAILDNPTDLAKRHDWIDTAVLYHLVHAIAILALAAFPAQKSGTIILAAMLFTAGIALFSGALYILAITGFTPLGMVAPVGGLAFLAGWICVITASFKSDHND